MDAQSLALPSRWRQQAETGTKHRQDRCGQHALPVPRSPPSEAHCLPFLSSKTCSGSPWSPQMGVQTSSDAGAIRFASDENKNPEWRTEKSKEPAFIKGQAHSQFAFRHSLIQELNGVPRIHTIFSHLSALLLLRGLSSNRFSCQMARGL